jgi:protein gp37
MSAPLDHVAIGHDRICVPPDGKPRIVCQLWPECMCAQDCADLADARTVHRLLGAFLGAVLVIAGGLIFWGMQALRTRHWTRHRNKRDGNRMVPDAMRSPPLPTCASSRNRERGEAMAKMADKSAIEWTDATWNPIVGCSIVSPGCTNCYAMKMAGRIEAMGGAKHYAGTTKKVNGNTIWTGKLALAPEKTLLQPLAWRAPRRIFVNSMGDLFHEDVPDAWIDKVFAVMALAKQHTFQVLTKRANRMREYFEKIDRELRQGGEQGYAPRRLDQLACDLSGSPCAAGLMEATDWPLPNVWLGVSAERQQEADERIPELLATPAAVRFVSAEPLLGPINFVDAMWAGEDPALAPGRIDRLDHRRRRERPRCPPDASGLGALAARPVPRGRHGVFLQAVGRGSHDLHQSGCFGAVRAQACHARPVRRPGERGQHGTHGGLRASLRAAPARPRGDDHLHARHRPPHRRLVEEPRLRALLASALTIRWWPRTIPRSARRWLRHRVSAKGFGASARLTDPKQGALL